MPDQAAATRAAILAAVRTVALERGFDRLRVADVARRSGVSTGLVHYHFVTRDGLIAAALRSAAADDLDAADAAVAPVADPLEQLDRFLGTYAPEPDRAGWQLWVDAWGQALRSAELATILAELERAWHDRLASVIRDAAAQGSVHVEDAGAAAEELLAVATGLGVAVVVHRSLTPESASERLRAAARRLLDATDP